MSTNLQTVRKYRKVLKSAMNHVEDPNVDEATKKDCLRKIFRAQQQVAKIVGLERNDGYS